VRKPDELKRFERVVMPHLGAGYTLARWLTRNEHDAEDMVQESYLRALRSFDQYRGGDARSWILTIVRNTCYTWLRQNRVVDLARHADPDHDRLAAMADDPAAQPETQCIRGVERRLLHEGLDALPVEFREALILRELEGFSYKEIADIADVPLGTVMSRLARARQQLQRFLLGRMKEGA